MTELKGLVPDHAVVQQHTTAYARNNGERRDIVVAFRISRSLAARIDSYQALHHRKRKTEALIDLLEAALYIMENAQRLEDPALVKYLQQNLYNVQLVDDIMEWQQDRIEAIIGALVSEKERRFRLKLGRQHDG